VLALNLIDIKLDGRVPLDLLALIYTSNQTEVPKDSYFFGNNTIVLYNISLQTQYDLQLIFSNYLF
jgi:hypothetical protein